MHIDQLVNRFRKALDAITASGGFSECYFRDFPKYCCGGASELLALYLAEHGIKTLYVSAIREKDSHAWLVLADDMLADKFDKIWNGTIIDITADQYKDRRDMEYYDVPVYIGEPDEFHKKFTIDYTGDFVANFRIVDMDIVTAGIWQTIRNYLHNEG